MQVIAVCLSVIRIILTVSFSVVHVNWLQPDISWNHTENTGFWYQDSHI